MADPFVKSFDYPDRVIELPGVRQEMLEIGGVVIGRVVHQPGWRWSTHIRPVVGTESCQAHHVGVAVSGSCVFEMSDGTSHLIPPGAAFDIPPGHDGWVVGDEPYVTLDWNGVREWLVPRYGERTLATLYFSDIVDSTAQAERLGDRTWRSLVAAHDETTREQLALARAREVDHAGDSFFALFEGPAKAIDGALAIRARVRALGLDLRQGVHVGEVEIAERQVRGVAVHEAARIAASAGPGELLVSEVTRSLATGAGVLFEPRGARELKGLAGPRTLFAVVSDPQS